MNRFYVVCFDVADDKRLRKVAIELENVGTRVQYSVFECYLNPEQLEQLKQRLAAIINATEDHVRYYSLCNKDLPKIAIDGSGRRTDDVDYHTL